MYKFTGYRYIDIIGQKSIDHRTKRTGVRLKL